MAGGGCSRGWGRGSGGVWCSWLMCVDLFYVRMTWRRLVWWLSICFVSSCCLLMLGGAALLGERELGLEVGEIYDFHRR